MLVKFKKTVEIIILTLILTLLISSCSLNDSPNREKDLISIIEKIEIANLKLRGKQITFEEYEKEIKDSKKYFSEYFEGFDLIYNEEEYNSTYKDTKAIDLDKVTIKISKVYDIDYDESLNNKFIYTQIVFSKFYPVDFSDDRTDRIDNKRYEFTKRDNKWEIREIVLDSYNTAQLEPTVNFEGQNMKTHIPRFDNHNDEDIDFIKVIKPN
ncbi:hypothetical protein [Sporosalibacterium faouarense]|uniref:hypothetical protein n=1 Tax=Sporosalibacterium faouarense TaxID=516123 RepID=UPI00192B1D34|nr:hypothetical protein [Sporosalibacterium faouarense]